MGAPAQPLVVLFDVDGTLIDTGGAGARSWAGAFSDVMGHEADITAFTESGMTDPVVARRTFRGAEGRDPSNEELSRLIAAYLMRLPEAVAGSSGYRVLPGVPELLESLARRGALLGLVSGNIEGAARVKIERGGLNRFFPFGGYGTDSADRAELTRAAITRASELHGAPVDPGYVFVVGDTPRDVEAAHGAGAISLTVATGAFDEDRLREAGADHVLATFETPFAFGPLAD
jgi:phosphoglycolate phosphatase